MALQSQAAYTSFINILHSFAQLEDIVGYFVNTVALRVKVAANGGAPTLSELVHNAHDTVLDALEHAACPFSCVVDALQVPRDPTRSPIFQVF